MVIYASLEGNASGKRKYRKKTEKSFENPIDKWEILWYDSKAVPERGKRGTDIEN